MVNVDDTGSGPFSTKETIFAIGSGVAAIGFWGLAIDIALKSYIYQTSLTIQVNDAVWFFAATFVIGLVAMGICSLKRVGAKRKAVSELVR